MLLIDCPWCGARDETEFRYGGEAHISRPPDPAALSDAQWAEYLFMRSNPKGLYRERWVHAQGCRRWFNAERHTVTHRITATYKPGEPVPVAEGAGPERSEVGKAR
jgi:sarcosine oxidase subunit delta